jgi:O-antigen ligase
LIVIFLLLLLLPLQPEVAGLRLDPYRVFLLLVMAGVVPAFLSGRAGPFRLPDALMIGFGIWMVVTLLLHHGAEWLPYAVTQVADLVGGYMLARLCLRTPEDFRRFVFAYILFLIALAPFALVEFLTGRAPIVEFLNHLGPTIEAYGAERSGFFRAQVVFPHSILFGLFCSIAFSNILYSRGNVLSKVSQAGIATFVTILSLSSAAALSLLIQFGLAVWGYLTGRRWRLLLGLAFATFLGLEIASNRGPFILLIETLTFDPQTGWWRVYIWEYGSQSVLDHPLVGIGLNDWVRPEWMYSGSVDNFWLVIAMRYGLPGFLLLGGALALLMAGILRQPMIGAAAELRTGYAIGWVALSLVLCTVHIWDAVAAFVSFYFGAAASFLGAITTSSGPAHPQENASEVRSMNQPDSPGQGREGRQIPFSRYTNRFSSNTRRKAP